eukprot:6854932-Prymnesium_polylepis.1
MPFCSERHSLELYLASRGVIPVDVDSLRSGGIESIDTDVGTMLQHDSHGIEARMHTHLQFCQDNLPPDPPGQRSNATVRSLVGGVIAQRVDSYLDSTFD